ncbi:unnamed protein product [Cuscuta campestris]|uniref:DUF7815 domain-containing protein n=1 Tax=Cuscuta campestris TaxID=132261 RepID=A0A484MKT1_9ASTE|nr:unnamed protein product [Cuscuta campestris]
MSHDALTDLIRQVQILTRTESGLPDYDPKDPSIPPLPSISDAIANFDPSPPYLRCKRCRGRLLKGLQSLICIYCGQKQHQNDDPSAPDPISFNSTLSCRWLLQSLRLDGSEKVGTPSEKGEKPGFNRGHSTSRNNISLSELLDIKIGLFNKQEKPEKNQELQGSSLLNNGGVDLDSFFPRQRGDNTSGDTTHPPKNEEAKTVGILDHNLFQNVQPLQQEAVPSQTHESGEFCGWEADFRSADSKTFDPVSDSTVNSGSQVGSFQSADAFVVGSAIDLSDHMDSIFGNGKDLYGTKEGSESETLHRTSDWSSDDLWNTATTEVFQPEKPFDSKIEVNDFQQNGLNTSPTKADWVQDDQWPTSFSSAENIDEDSFDEWNDFTSSSNVKTPQEKEIIQIDNHAEVPLDNLVSDNANELSYGLTNVDGSMFDDWNDFMASTLISKNDGVVDALGNTLESNMVSSSNEFGDMDFGSFWHAEHFLSSHHKESASESGTRGPEQNHFPGSSSSLDDNGTGKGLLDGGGVALRNNTISNQSGGNEDIVESLLSQMHDLSFMLETNLSIPPKSDSNPPH